MKRVVNTFFRIYADLFFAHTGRKNFFYFKSAFSSVNTRFLTPGTDGTENGNFSFLNVFQPAI